LRGRGDLAIQAPSGSSLIVLDIDRHVSAATCPEERFEAELRANGRRGEVLSAVWRAYGFSANRQPAECQLSPCAATGGECVVSGTYAMGQGIGWA
jgi:hypothetical protein